MIKSQQPFSLNNVILFVIFLAAMNFLLYGSYLIILAFLICCIINRFEVAVPRASFVLFIFAVCYLMFDSFASGTLSLRIIAAPLSYVIAYNLAKESNGYKSENMFLFIAIGMAIHGILSFLRMYLTYGICGFSAGKNIDVWSGIISSSTGQAANYYFLIAAIPLLFMRRNFTHYAVFALALVHDVLMGGRTFIVLSVIALVLFLVIRTIMGEKGSQTLLKYLLIIALISVAVIFMYQRNIFNIRTTFESSYMWRRFFSNNPYEELGETGRWAKKLIYLENIFTYPFGGNHIRDVLGVGYAHDIWLDTFGRAGIFSMLILLVYSASSVRNFFKFAATCDETREKVLFFIFPIVMNIAFFVEPIIDGCPMAFFMYCFIDGFIAKKREDRQLT